MNEQYMVVFHTTDDNVKVLCFTHKKDLDRWILHNRRKAKIITLTSPNGSLEPNIQIKIEENRINATN